MVVTIIIIYIIIEARPPFTHAVSEPSMTSADQPPSHSDVHRSRSTPGNMVMGQG